MSSITSVDVVVPCYRYGRFLRECVESVLAQDQQNVRVLIIDDASPDSTSDIADHLAKSDSRVTFFRHNANKGHIATYNEGIDWASADYMLILSADDYLLPGALSRSIRFMDGHPDVGLVCGNALELMEGSTEKLTSHNDTDVKCHIFDSMRFIELCGKQNIVQTPTAVVRTTLQKRLGGYRTELPHSGDLEMWLRFAAHSSVGFINAYQAVYRRHNANMSSAYMRNGWLPDLRQRKLALDFFFESCGDKLPNVKKLRRRLYYSLSCAAVSFASAAFNRGDNTISEQVSDLAIRVSPRIKWSVRWAKLALKRQMGLRAWKRLQPMLLRDTTDTIHNGSRPKTRKDVIAIEGVEKVVLQDGNRARLPAQAARIMEPPPASAKYGEGGI
jgi:glycosyltransferase involved in cell wall biosynthesis